MKTDYWFGREAGGSGLAMAYGSRLQEDDETGALDGELSEAEKPGRCGAMVYQDVV